MRRYAVITLDQTEKPSEVIELWECPWWKRAFQEALITMQARVWQDREKVYAVARLHKNGNVKRVLYTGGRSRLFNGRVSDRPAFAGVLETAA